MSEPSGRRDPAAAIRGVGAITLVVEAVVLLLAIQPIRLLGGPRSGAAIAAVLVLAVAAVVLAGLLRQGWAWSAALGLQAVLVAGGLLHGALAVLGVVFALAWGFVLYVRRRLLTS